MEHGEGRDRDKGFAAMPANTAGGNRLRGIYIEVHTMNA